MEVLSLFDIHPDIQTFELRFVNTPKLLSRFLQFVELLVFGTPD